MIALHPCYVVNPIIIRRDTTLRQEVLNRISDERKRKPVSDIKFLSIKKLRRVLCIAYPKLIGDVRCGIPVPRCCTARTSGLLAATRQTRELLSDVIQLNIVWKQGYKAAIDEFDSILVVDVIVDAEPPVFTGAAVWGVETETLSISRIAGVVVIRLGSDKWCRSDSRNGPCVFV